MADPVEKAKDVAHAVEHPVETAKDLAEEAERGRSPRTPLLLISGVMGVATEAEGRRATESAPRPGPGAA